MSKILAFGASNSKASINKKLASYAASLMDGHEISIADLNDYELPLFGVDLEKEIGHPVNAIRFSELVEEHDGLIISLAEHNSNFTAVFKNLGDWMSRFHSPTWRNKKVLLLATSNGKRGAVTALEIGLEIMPFRGADITAHFSLPSFSSNFSEEEGLHDQELKDQLLEQIKIFDESLKGVDTNIS
jgi:NAD(P)H-dependent FMN reductase